MVDRKASDLSQANPKTAYLTFTTSEALNNFLKRKTEPVVKDKQECCVMGKFRSNRILFTAEHAQTKKIELPEYGKRAYAGIGDTNTDILAKLGAYYTRSAYIIPLFLRTEADASRPVEDLGKGLTLFTKVFYTDKKIHLAIHTDTSFRPYLEKYHETIEKLNPKAIMSIHGMNIKRKFDVLFGFGDDYKAIGDKKTALEFKLGFIEHLDRVFELLGMRNNLEIAVSTWFLAGSRNEILARHIINHNKQAKKEDRRFGVQVEFNWRGRAMEADKSIPTLPYQLTVQALGDFILKWTKNKM